MPTNFSPRVWDIPTRLFHWSIVVLVGFSWWSAENHQMEWHYRSGITLLILLVFRLIWGVIGGSTARFIEFIPTPGRISNYLHKSRSAAHHAGHNPLGAFSVFAMLTALTVQVGTGLFAVDTDGLESGPLSSWISFSQGRQAAAIHEISFSIVQILVALHIAAILFYLIFRRRNLIGPMITGRDNAVRADTALKPAPLWAFLLAAGVALAIGWWVSAGAPL